MRLLPVVVLLAALSACSVWFTYSTEVGRDLYCYGRIDALEIPALSPCR